MRPLLLLCASLTLVASCKTSNSLDYILETAKTQCIAMDQRLTTETMPRTLQDGKIVDSNLRWWCSGFFPGTLWYLYDLTKDEQIKAIAINNTHKLDSICSLRTNHDIGFQVMCSFGNEYRFTGDTSSLAIIRAAAAKLARRYNPKVGCTVSWDNHMSFQCPVIIDNMMNLELLMKGAELFDCDSLRQIAINHANTTMKNHFRQDYSSYHLVEYYPETGEVNYKRTVQGFADETAWSRGQAWGLYGYTMMYEKTGDERYLTQAEKIAGYIIPLLPEDAIPYWDFNAPGTKNAVPLDAKGHPENYPWKEGDEVLRDASAGAIMASALISLSRNTKDKSLAKKYMKIAKKQIATLSSPEYFAEPMTNGNFLLKHSVGNLHGNSEVDVPLTYADYYYLEAIWKIKNNQ